MNLADIRAWLASEQDYAAGRALYAALGASAAYQRLFALPPTDYSRQVLARELSALVALPATEPAPPVVAPVLVLVPAPELLVNAEALLADLYQQLRAVRDERSHLHPQLTARGTGQVRRLALASRIVALTHQEVELKAHVAHVQLHGRLPGPVALAEVTDAGELQRRLLNLRSQRTRLGKQPARAADYAQVLRDIEFIENQLAR